MPTSKRPTKAEPRVFNIKKSQLPSQSVELSFKEPTYGDYRNARKRYPTVDKVPYSIEELLFSTCMLTANGPLPPHPKDMAERLTPFPIPDRQFLMQLFIEMFFLTRDQAQDAVDLAETFLKDPSKPSYTIDHNRFPAGSPSITFRSPNTGVQMAVQRDYTGVAQVGSTLEECLLAVCVTHIDGNKAEQLKTPVSMFDDWPIADVQFVTAVFLNLFTIDNKQESEAKKLAAMLLESTSNGNGSSASVTSASTSKAQSATAA